MPEKRANSARFFGGEGPLLSRWGEVLLYASLHLSGYGRGGPKSDRPGYGTLAEAMSGRMWVESEIDRGSTFHFTVEVKPFGNDLPSELAGCPVEKNVTSDALVRQAFSAVLIAAGAAGGEAVIVRETPPPGRDVAVSVLDLPALGWTVVLEPPGVPQIVAAPAPLRLIDATWLAATIVASRAGDGELDRVGLANLLRRASHLAADLGERLVRLDLPRVVVGGRGARTLVIDAGADLA